MLGFFWCPGRVFAVTWDQLTIRSALFHIHNSQFKLIQLYIFFPKHIVFAYNISIYHMSICLEAFLELSWCTCKHLHTFHCMETNTLPSFFVERNYAFSFSHKHQTKPSKKLTCPPQKNRKNISQQKNHSPQKSYIYIYIYPLNKNQNIIPGSFCWVLPRKKTTLPTLPRCHVSGGRLWHTSTQLPGDSRHPSGQGDGWWWVDGWEIRMKGYPKMDGEHSWKTRN